jgi:hypothetical protein
MALNQTNPGFPSPYINTVKPEGEEPLMVAVRKNHSDIGARASGMPKDIKNSNSIEHVGGTAGSK